MPGDSVTAESENALKPQDANAQFADGHQVNCVCPDGKRQMRILHYGTNHNGEVAFAIAALQ